MMWIQSRRRLWVAGGALVITIAIASGVFIWHRAHANPFPAQIRTTSTVPLWFPGHLPDGLTLDPESFSYKSGVLLYHFNAADSKLHFTIQNVDPKFSFDNFYDKILQHNEAVITPYGTAHIGSMGTNTVASLVVGNIWIMAIYNQSGFDEELGPIMKSLHRY